MQKLNEQVIGLFLCCTLIFGFANAEPSKQTVYGPIKSGDMLWHIAGEISPENVSVTRYQVMIALFKTNAQAFRVPCNIHSLLKVGQMLRIPSLAEMQATSHAAAVALFNQQKTVWENRRTQAITCPAEEEKQETIIQEKKLPIVTKPEEAVKKSVLPPSVIEPQQKTETKKPQKTVTETPANFLATVFPLPTSAIISLSIIVGLFVLALFIGWLLHRYVPQKESFRRDYNKQSDTEHEPTRATEETASSESSDNDDIGSELNQARACLAQGDTQTAKAHLMNILNKGHPDQQQEARQLLEITMQMSTLELQAMQSHETSNFEDKEKTSQALTEVSSHAPLSQYLFEDEEKITEFVGKVFKFIDHELNAQGKLVAAYNKMEKRNADLEVTEYQLDDTAKQENQKKSREHKPTRYL